MGAISKMLIMLLLTSMVFIGMVSFLNANAVIGGRPVEENTDLDILGNVSTLTDDIQTNLNQAINSAINPVNGILIITNSAFQAIGLILQTPLIFMKAAAQLFVLTPFVPDFIVTHITLMGLIIAVFVLAFAILKIKA